MSRTANRMTAGELADQLRADPAAVVQRARRDSESAARTAVYRAEQAEMLAELRKVGIDIQLVSDLVNTSTNYGQAIPILVKHLPRPYSEATREGIARALAVPEARAWWSILLDEYRSAPATRGRASVKEGLAAALAATASDEVIGDLVAVATDPSQGETRVLLLSALRRSKEVEAKRALRELATDPVCAGEIASWKRRRGT